MQKIRSHPGPFGIKRGPESMVLSKPSFYTGSGEKVTQEWAGLLVILLLRLEGLL